MKKVIEPEFHRPLQVDRVPATGSHEKFAADEAERLAVATRLGINAVESLSAHLKALPWRGGVQITGTVKATVNQDSVVSLEPFESELSFQVERYFMPPKATVPEGEEEVDLIEHGEVDMGEIVVEQLALELDPYPRRPGEVFQVDQPIEIEEKKSPFAALEKLKRD